jgi:hypothetical protein
LILSVHPRNEKISHPNLKRKSAAPRRRHLTEEKPKMSQTRLPRVQVFGATNCVFMSQAVPTSTLPSFVCYSSKSLTRAALNTNVIIFYSTNLKFSGVAWNALKKSLNGIINKVNVSNLKNIVPEIFQENLVRGR